MMMMVEVMKGDEGSAIVSAVSMALYVSCVQEAPPGGQPSL